MLDRKQIEYLMLLWNNERDYEPGLSSIIDVALTKDGGSIKITSILSSNNQTIRCIDNYILIGGSKEEPYLQDEPFYIPSARKQMKWLGTTRDLDVFTTTYDEGTAQIRTIAGSINHFNVDHRVFKFGMMINTAHLPKILKAINNIFDFDINYFNRDGVEK